MGDPGDLMHNAYVPRGTDIPEVIKPICLANADIELIEAHWDQLVHLTASVHTGHSSAVTALARFGSAARGDPIYEAGVQLGRLLRTVFIGRIAPTRIEGINLRGAFRFPIEQFADQILPSASATKIAVGAH